MEGKSKSPVEAAGKRPSHSRSRSRSNSKASVQNENPGSNVYIANLPRHATEEDLREKFGKFGKITEHKIVRDPYTKESRGFGFVKFENVDDAAEAIKSLNGSDMDGKQLRVEKAKRRDAYRPTPGKYLGPRRASYKYNGHREHQSHHHYRSRSRSRSPRYSPYKRYSNHASPLNSKSRSRSRSRSRSFSGSQERRRRR